MDAYRVAVTRFVAAGGDIVEAVHRVHAVAVRDGIVVASAGDPGLVSFLRSAWKPLQAVALAESYDDLADEELAIACASHRAEPAQLDAVRMLLARAGATVDDLENGEQEGRPHGRLGHNCSGKHAGMLAACRARDWPLPGYRFRGHPLQRRLAQELGPTLGEAVDGCGVPVYALALRDAAALLLRVRPDVARAMRARPELVGGDGSDDTELMRALPGWIAKRGAEGLLCAASPDGLGIALKVEDGNPRGLRPATGALLAGLGIEAAGFVAVPLRNSLGEPVGEVAVGRS
jgi:L-asparaginase II